MKARLVFEPEDEFERSMAVKVSHYFSWGGEKATNNEWSMMEVIEMLARIGPHRFKCQVTFPIERGR